MFKVRVNDREERQILNDVLLQNGFKMIGRKVVDCIIVTISDIHKKVQYYKQSEKEIKFLLGFSSISSISDRRIVIEIFLENGFDIYEDLETDNKYLISKTMDDKKEE